MDKSGPLYSIQSDGEDDGPEDQDFKVGDKGGYEADDVDLIISTKDGESTNLNESR